MAWTTVGVVHVQAIAVMDNVARMVLPLLLRGVSLRSDALSSVLDDNHMQPATASSSELHVTRYRGPLDGEEEMLTSTVLSHDPVAYHRVGWVQPKRCGSPAAMCIRSLWMMRQ